jgi:hypothetical protein
MESFQVKLVMKDLQARRVSNLEVETKILHELNGLSQAERRSLPQDHSSGAFPTGDHQTDLLSFGESVSTTSSLSVERALLGDPTTQVRCVSPWRQPFDCEEINHRWLFHINPKRIYIWLKFDDHRSQKIVKGRRAASREIREMGICYIYLLFTR